MNRTSSAAAWSVSGGLAFWLPVVFMSAVAKVHVSEIALNLGPLVGLIALAATARVLSRRSPPWGWVLLGLYVLGPAAMLTATAVGGGPSSQSLPGEWLWLVVVCLLPPMTLWLATLNGLIGSVLVASAVLLLLARVQRREVASFGDGHAA
jgi:hypothetical protein